MKVSCLQEMLELYKTISIKSATNRSAFDIRHKVLKAARTPTRGRAIIEEINANKKKISTTLTTKSINRPYKQTPNKIMYKSYLFNKPRTNSSSRLSNKSRLPFMMNVILLLQKIISDNKSIHQYFSNAFRKSLNRLNNSSCKKSVCILRNPKLISKKEYEANILSKRILHKYTEHPKLKCLFKNDTILHISESRNKLESKCEPNIQILPINQNSSQNKTDICIQTEYATQRKTYIEQNRYPTKHYSTRSPNVINMMLNIK